MFKQIIKYLFLFLMIGLLGFLFGFTSSRNNQKMIKKPIIKFSGNKNYFLNEEIVNKLLIQKEQTLENKEKTKLDLYKLEKAILSNPYVEDAAVFLAIDGTLTSVINQRSPLVRIMNGKESYYADKKGVKIPFSENFSARVPLVSGVNVGEDLDKIINLITHINQDDFLQKEIIGVNKYNANEYEFAVRSGDYKIDFGELSQISLKFKKLKAYYNVAFKDNSIKDYKTITVKFHNQVVCTK